MKTFLLELHQDGGCDYTIACGTLTTTIVAKNLDKAREKASDFLGAYLEDGIESATLYEVTQTTRLDLKAIRGERARQRDLEELREKERAERAELERLKAKYEG